MTRGAKWGRYSQSRPGSHGPRPHGGGVCRSRCPHGGRYVHRAGFPRAGGSHDLKSAWPCPYHRGRGRYLCGPPVGAGNGATYSKINVQGNRAGGPSIHARGRGMWGLKGRGSGVPPFRAVLICAAPMPGAGGCRLGVLPLSDEPTISHPFIHCKSK